MSSFRNRIRAFVIDLSHLDELPPSLVVLLLEYRRARRHGGEVTWSICSVVHAMI
jgi:hypothetical protein